MEKNEHPSFLKGVASIGAGMARLLDFSTSLPAPLSPEETAKADATALRKDWETVGDDLYHAMGISRPTRAMPLTKNSR